jgi:hypothetical protein
MSRRSRHSHADLKHIGIISHEGFVQDAPDEASARKLNFAAARDWIRDGNILKEGTKPPAEVRKFFEAQLKNENWLGDTKAFDDQGRFTHEAADLIGKFQTQNGYHLDKKIGPQTFHGLFDMPNEEGHSKELRDAHDNILKQFATDFYKGGLDADGKPQDPTVKPDATSKEYDLGDARASGFRDGLDAVRDSLVKGDGKLYDAKFFGRDNELTEAQKHKVEKLAERMKAPDGGGLTQDNVKAFQELMNMGGFKDHGHKLETNGDIDRGTARSLMNFGLMNGRMNADFSNQAVLASNNVRINSTHPLPTLA